MIVREDRTFEINLNYPNSNWTGETEGVYVVDETTPEGQALAEKIMMLFPYFDLVIVDGELVDVVENPDLKQEWEEEQEFLEEDDEIERITLEELGLDQVDNTSDLDKPISRATQAALDGKVDKVEGKGLSTRDFLPEYEEKLAGIEPGANKYIHPETHPASMITGLANVATSGDYEDLLNKPTTLPPSEHTHEELMPKTGGTFTGEVNMSSQNRFMLGGKFYIRHNSAQNALEIGVVP